MRQNTPQSPQNNSIEAAYGHHVMPIWKSLNVPVESASGCILRDFDGTEYLDLFSGISVTNVGHGNDRVVSRAKEQLETLVHGCSYVHPNRPVADLAERLATITPGDLEKSFFCNSGTEAVEGAIKLARKYTGRKEIISLEMAFHGRTLGSLSLTGNKAYKADMGPTLNDTAQAPPPYEYRCQSCDVEEGCSSQCTAQLERVVDSHTTGDLAAVIVEPIMGEGGIIVPPDGWLESVEELVRQHDALLIVDEVQTGYGRTGKMWATDHVDVAPDIITQAKGMANGLPLGAFTTTTEIADSFEPGDHLSTFGGNPVACAASLATIEELQNGIIENAAEQGQWLGSKLEGMKAEFDVVGSVRGRGLMWGIELVDTSTVGPMGVAPKPDKVLSTAVASRLREEHNIVMGVGGFYKNVLRIQPPLTISRPQLERAVDALERALEAETKRTN